MIKKYLDYNFFLKLQRGSHKRKREEPRGELIDPMVQWHFRALVTSRVHRDPISIIKDALTTEQLKIFQTMCFNHFLYIHDMRFNRVLVHLFILKEVIRVDAREQLWFKVNGIDVRLSAFEFALITNFHFNKLTNIDHYLPWGVRHMIYDTYIYDA